MASATFSNLPDIEDVTFAGQDVSVTTTATGREDAHGMPETGPPWQAFVVRRPVAADGDQPLRRIAAASTGDGWKWKLGQEAEWPKARFVLDKDDGWEISYEGSRLLIDAWRLQPSAHGVGFEEVLELRAFNVERRRNAQNVLPFRTAPDGAAK
jgi:hypothetical protein